MKLNTEKVSRGLFYFSLATLLVGYGFSVGYYKIFPYRQLREVRRGFIRLATHFGFNADAAEPPTLVHELRNGVYNSSGAQEGVNFVTSIVPDVGGNRLSVKVMSMDGETIHEWEIDWFKIWPAEERGHIPEHLLPQSRPGAIVHGAVIMKNGDLVFNCENLGLIRLRPDGEPVWRLPYITHHAVHLESGHIWVCGRKYHEQRQSAFPNYEPPFDEYTLLEVSDDGKILQEISIFELLQQNHLSGLLYLGTNDRHTPQSTGDTLHLNDVEPFSTELPEGFFRNGDVMISLRNINTILVFERDSHKVKFLSVGRFILQHDPDFIDGSTISVLDNNALGDSNAQSRIVRLHAPDGESAVAFQGSSDAPFFTAYLGKHQWLPNGNLLVTESRRGRAFEVDPQGNVVWEFVNYGADGQVGLVTEVTRLPLAIGKLYAN